MDSKYVPLAADDLTWTDTYYEKEKDIIAVFDTDHASLKRGITCRTVFACLVLGLYAAFFITLHFFADDPRDSWIMFFYAGLFTWIAYRMIQLCKYLTKVVETGLHICVTKSGVRRDLNKFPMGSMFRTTVVVS